MPENVHSWDLPLPGLGLEDLQGEAISVGVDVKKADKDKSRDELLADIDKKIKLDGS